MPIPAFNIDGVIPPFVGPHGPGGHLEQMSPYAVTALEVVATLGLSPGRRAILTGWLNHRTALRRIGFDRGFQWLDGSFVERKDPRDLDIVSFMFRPTAHSTAESLQAHMRINAHLFERSQVKSIYHLDFFPVDLNGSPEALVGSSRYWLGLFSHRRGDNVWKGMLQVRLEDSADDQAALSALATIQPSGGGAP